MTYRIRGLEPQPFAALFELDDAELEARGMTRMIVDNPNFPCRISLSDRELGEEVILLNHVSHDGNNPYRASHAIFVSKAAEAADYVDAIPPAEEYTIYEIQEGMVATQTPVLVKGAIVTSPLTFKKDGFFIQDAMGGEYSGIYVYVGANAVAVKPGDIVDVEGVKLLGEAMLARVL